jgi:hypothetical protein
MEKQIIKYAGKMQNNVIMCQHVRGKRAFKLG